MVEYKARIFKAKLDSDLLTLLVGLKQGLTQSKTRLDSLKAFIATYPTLFEKVYTIQERDEIEGILTTLTTLIDTALTALPEFIQP